MSDLGLYETSRIRANLDRGLAPNVAEARHLIAERDRYRNALDAILAEAREADDGWTITTCEEAIQGA